MKPGTQVTCIDGSNTDRKIRAGKTYTVALYRTAAEAIGIGTEAQIWIDGMGRWFEARRFKETV